MLTKDKLEALKKEYPVGTKVVLDYMDDDQAPPPGTKGIVTIIDDAGTIFVVWETGSSLGLIYNTDEFHKDVSDEKHQ